MMQFLWDVCLQVTKEVLLVTFIDALTRYNFCGMCVSMLKRGERSSLQITTEALLVTFIDAFTRYNISIPQSFLDDQAGFLTIP